VKRYCCAVLLAILLIGLTADAYASDVLYTANVTYNFANSVTLVYAKPDTGSQVLSTFKAGKQLDVLWVLPNFAAIRTNGGIGYILRHRIENVIPLDPVHTPPYGVEVNRFYSVLTQETCVRESPDTESRALITLQTGTVLSFIDINQGWARLIFKRQYGFVDTRLLDALEMIAQTPDEGTPDIPIAAYTSFYNIDQSDANQNRISNLKVGCSRMEKEIPPGTLLNFNDEVGPFTAGNGYLEANILLNGELAVGYGGGSCQVSSTLYNVVLQMTGITVIRRSPHGSNGAPYLPHGVDASSGDLNFIIRNDYDFPIRIWTHVQDGALYIAVYKAVS
jgi:hypothetical protein